MNSRIADPTIPGAQELRPAPAQSASVPFSLPLPSSRNSTAPFTSRAPAATPARTSSRWLTLAVLTFLGSFAITFWLWLSARDTVILIAGTIISLLLSVVVWALARTRQLTLQLEQRVGERTAELEELHHQLLTAAQQASVAEIATGVLHNVNNVLTSVVISAELAIDCLRDSKIDNLRKIGALLKEHAGDLAKFISEDPRGQKIPGYAVLLADQLAADRTRSVAELEQLQRHLDHIKDIVGKQQSFARISATKETLRVVDLVDDALSMNANALAQHGFEVARDFRAFPSCTTDRHKVLQILINLIRNAKFACDESPDPLKRISVRVTQEDDLAKIWVIDNGVGIRPENLPRIFTHGFTTRQNGHGFGLHSGLAIAKELGGTLTAHSEGPGRGALFCLALPLDA